MGRGGKFLLDDPNPDEFGCFFLRSCLGVKSFVLLLVVDEVVTGSAWA